MRMVLLLGLIGLLSALPATGQQNVTVYFEDFDDVGSVGDLEGWDIGDGWDIDGTTSSNGSGYQSLKVSGGPAGSAVTSPIDLRRLSEGTFSYLIRRTGSFYENSILITASTDGGLTFPYLIADSTESAPGGTSWASFTFDLPQAVLGEPDVRFRIENVVGGSGSANAKFDDITVAGLAIFDIHPPQGLFAAEVGETDAQTFTVTNYSTSVLNVDPPSLTGTAFSISPSTAVGIAPAEEQVYTITFAPDEDGVFEETLEIAADGAGAVTVPLLGLTALNQVSFALASSEAGEAETDLPVDVSLTFSSEAANLQGLELSISWDDEIISLSGVDPGPQVSSNGWSLSYEASAQAVKVLLYDDHGIGLPPDHYDPIISLKFDASLLNNGEREVALSIDNVIGALAVPTADDAGLFIKEAEHTIFIAKRYAYFDIDVEDLDFGLLQAGSSDEASFTISNPDGERTLGIIGMTFSGGPYSVSPAAAFIAPDASETFTVTFAPTATDFGLADVTLAISHDGELNGVYDLPVTGIGVFGRGDNDGDGMVDAMDIINTIDFILDRTQPTSLQLGVSDLFPFDAGDDALDIRDLSVSVQAIVRGIWPDDVELPVSYDPVVAGILAAKRSSAPSSVLVTVQRDRNDLVLEVQNEEPLRALQLHLRVEHLSGAPILELNAEGAPTASGRAEADDGAGMVRILLYRPDGGTIDPGTYRFATIPRHADGGYIDLEYATAVAEGSARRAVEIEGLVASGVEGNELPERVRVDQAYPNPFSISASSSVRLPIHLPQPALVSYEVFDLLGRRLKRVDVEGEGRLDLSWEGDDASGAPVAPGVFLIRVILPGHQFVRQVVVVR